jgi:hypothetical protein
MQDVACRLRQRTIGGNEPSHAESRQRRQQRRDATPSCSAEAGSLQPRPTRSYAHTIGSGANAVEIQTPIAVAARSAAANQCRDVLSQDDAAAFMPAGVLTANGDAAVERDHDLDRVMHVRGHEALSSGGEEEATFHKHQRGTLNQRYGPSFG